MTIRHREVAVAVVFDQPSQSFLLRHNHRWGGYAFPMKQIQGDAAEQTALAAVEDDEGGLRFPGAQTKLLDHVHSVLRSEALGTVTIYDYQVFEVETGTGLPSPLHPDWKLFTYDELQTALNVTTSTKEIARSFVEDRKVAVAVVCRCSATGPELLLVNNPNHGYFFPSTRIKAESGSAEAAVNAVRSDLGYESTIEVTLEQAETLDVKHSLRFGPGDRRFVYYVHQVEFPGVDLLAAGNELEGTMNQMPTAAGMPNQYWRWCNEDQLRNDPQMSPSIPALLTPVMRLAQQKCGE